MMVSLDNTSMYSTTMSIQSFPPQRSNAAGGQCTLRLTNPGIHPSAFKVKTTKPKRYLVRPNQGTVAPGATTVVSILLLAQEKRLLMEEYRETGSTDESNKFMVQSVPAPGGGGGGRGDSDGKVIKDVVGHLRRRNEIGILA
ncbi:unnamed protein product [Discosporangium mesarthrocarpum]